MNVDYSAHERKTVTAQVEMVLSRGEVVVDQRKYVGRAGHGTFVPRSTCEYLS